MRPLSFGDRDMTTPITEHEDPLRIPIVEEQVRIDKEIVETARVIVRSSVVSDDVIVRDQLRSVGVRVERIPVDRFVDTAPEPRTEPNRTIVFVTEEVIVKRLRVIEEVHLITDHKIEAFEEQTIVRRQEVEIERVDCAKL